MAVEKKTWLDPTGVQSMATLLYKSINSRIKERIATAVTDGTSGTINSRTDDNHALSSKVVLGLVDTINTTIENLTHEISSLTHLTYQVVQGDIATEVPVADAKRDVIYLQHDDPAPSVGTDNYLLDENGDHAEYDDGENPAYNAIKDGTKYYKMVDGVKGAELASDDPIWDDVAFLDDDTYNLYIALPVAYKKNASNFLVEADDTVCSVTKNGATYYAYWDSTSSKWMKSTSSSSYAPTDPAAELAETDEIFKNAGLAEIEWLCVGDTKLELSNYWSKNDSDVAALRDLIMEAIGSTAITNAVKAAFDATDPYAGSSSYMDSWMT